MNRRAESGVLQTFLIAFLVVGAAVTLMFTFISGLASNYGVDLTSSDLNTTPYDSFSDTYDTIEEIQADVTNISGTTDALLTVTEASYNVGMVVVKDVPTAAYKMVSGAAETFGIPSIFVNMVLGVIVAILLFGLINLIVKVFA